ncbi:DUF1684 domain-containing protein [Pseudonocardia sp. MH-G8]|uniref:DUF1684 domain-containing protein n=1 Tax=Pseudonocardia sp. MH-G8 TaxID=1854588 RepID=UPI000BA11C29|nr:DUF1684 domain-containing protein [Pseudonocardia sp. MH-G8]OZM75426.1 hypothetical protein CFP66_46545 [Pseudonocardia sp. MH-G8]
MVEERLEIDYEAWRRGRWDEIAGPLGKAGVVQLATITGSAQTVEGVPGRWDASDSDGLKFTAAGADGVSLDGRPVNGTVTLTGGSSLRLSGERTMAVSGGGGIYGLTVWDPAASSLAWLREIAVFPVDPTYVVDAEYRRTPGREVEIERLTDPPTKHILPAPADLVFDLAGQQCSLMVIETFPGNLLVVFTDSTSGAGTPDIGRWVVLPPVAGDTVRVDFNQAVLPLHVFSRAFPCPLAPEGNHLPVPVPVGERAPVHRESIGTREAMSTDLKDTATRYLRRLEAGDYAGMRALCTDTATVWHNDGKGQQTIDENLAMLKDGPAAEASLRYDITRQFTEADEVLQQHVLRITNADGPVGEVQAAMYFRFRDGLIDRIEEYANFIPASG